MNNLVQEESSQKLINRLNQVKTGYFDPLVIYREPVTIKPYPLPNSLKGTPIQSFFIGTNYSTFISDSFDFYFAGSNIKNILLKKKKFKIKEKK